MHVWSKCLDGQRNEGTLLGAWNDRLSRLSQGKSEGHEVEKSLIRASDKSDSIVRSTYDKTASTAEAAKDKVKSAGHSVGHSVKGAGHSIRGAGHSAKRCVL